MSLAKNVRKTGSMLMAAAAVLLLAAASAFGQDDVIPGSDGKWEAGLTGGAAFPMGAFKANVGGAGWSLAFYAGHRLGRSPVSFGFDLYYMNYGLRSHDEYLSGGIPVRVEVNTTNNVVQGLFYLRCQPRRGRIRPYIEGLAGVSYLYTWTSVYGTEYPYDEITSDTNFDYLTFSAGGGAGLDLYLSGGHPLPKGGRTIECRLDLKVRYLVGGRAQYLREDSIVYDRGEFIYLYRDSTTNLLSAQAGFSFIF